MISQNDTSGPPTYKKDLRREYRRQNAAFLEACQRVERRKARGRKADGKWKRVRVWSDEDKELLKKLYPDTSLTIDEIVARFPGKTKAAVQSYANCYLDIRRERIKKSTKRKVTAKKTVKVIRRYEAIKPIPENVSGLRPDHPALSERRTIFPSTVIDPKDSPRLFVSGRNSRKLGSHVSKGPWKGMPIYSLTLEERKTCPKSCYHWGDCYGNAMHRARRHKHGAALEEGIVQELKDLEKAHAHGFVIRLHVLGDFYSVDYVRTWERAMVAFPGLRVFGYTAWKPGTQIGARIYDLNSQYSDRWKVRFSVKSLTYIWAGETITVESAEQAKDQHAILCPAQTGETDCCGTCGLCWSETAWKKPIAFLLHGNPWKGRPKEKSQEAILKTKDVPPAPEDRPIIMRKETKMSVEKQTPARAQNVEKVTVEMHPALAGLLNELPPPGPWDEERKQKLFHAFAAIIDFVCPTDGPEAGA